MRLVKSLLERCFDLITLLSENAGGMPLGEISRRLDLPKSAAHRLLTSLISLGWAEQESETGFYRLSLRLAVNVLALVRLYLYHKSQLVMLQRMNRFDV